MRGWNVTNLSYVCYRTFLRIAQIGPCFQGPIHGSTLIMIRLGSLWYNCIHWSRFETLSSYKVLLFQSWSLFVELARKQTVTVILLQGCVPPPLLRHIVVIVVFACVRYLVVLPFHAYLKRNSDIDCT